MKPTPPKNALLLLPDNIPLPLVECLAACRTSSTPMPEALMRHWDNDALRAKLVHEHQLNEEQVRIIDDLHKTLLDVDPNLRFAVEAARAARVRFQSGVEPSSRPNGTDR